MGAARTSYAREVNNMCEVIGVDLYNQSVTGEVSKPMTAIATDSDHIPCVLIGKDETNRNDSK